MNNIDLLCISGLKRSGKDTCATLIEEILNENGVQHKKMMLASKLKEFLILSLPYPTNLTMDDMNGDTSFDRELPRRYPIEMMKIILNDFLLLIHNYIRDNNIVSSFSALRSKAIGVKIIENDMTKVMEKVKVCHKEFTLQSVEVSIRELLQLFGTDIARYDDNELWSKIVSNEIRIQRLMRPKMKFLVTDTRMDVEVLHMHRHGLKTHVIEVIRPSNISIPNHITDMGLTKNMVNETINNDSGLKELKDKMLKLCEDLKWI